MPWTYKQSTGELKRPDGSSFGFGFSGNHQGLNFPPFQTQHGVGPLPTGFYSMGAYIEKDPKMGLCVIRLDPNPGSVMFGRSGFYIHGAASLDTHGVTAFLNSSEGCICFRDCVARQAIWQSADRRLQVTA